MSFPTRRGTIVILIYILWYKTEVEKFKFEQNSEKTVVEKHWKSVILDDELGQQGFASGQVGIAFRDSSIRNKNWHERIFRG